MLILNDFDFGESFLSLYNIILKLIEGIGSIWDWLFDTHTVFDGLSFYIFDWHIVIIPSFKFTPIEALTVVGLTSLIVFWIIKSLMPLG